ncbi:hypothetical protein [Flavobacterium commune]|uniref:hypothetical protein n=1 Tax=Flavobacterium commune TaxID=1306519 RepID=UPI0012FA1364|nr:hypothetical protein [Flavobacterium commune]
MSQQSIHNAVDWSDFVRPNIQVTSKHTLTMENIDNIIGKSSPISDWKEFVKENFQREAGIYSFLTVRTLEIEYNNEKFVYPKRIVFESGYARSIRKLKTVETVTHFKKTVKVIEKKEVIPFGLYQRRNKYSGDFFEILADIIKSDNLQSYFSNDLLPINDNPLFSIDSKLNWPSYLLTLNTSNQIYSEERNEDISFLKDIAQEYGFHLPYTKSLEELIFIIFPMPYIKIVENKINKDSENEKLYLVLEFNDTSFFYTQKNLNIKLEALIKGTKEEVLLDKEFKLEFKKSKFQIVELDVMNGGIISYSSLKISINNVIVSKTSGYYIRDIKINVKTI